MKLETIGTMESANISTWYDHKLRSNPSNRTILQQVYFRVLHFSIEESNCGRPMSDQQQISFCEFYLHQVLHPYRLV